MYRLTGMKKGDILNEIQSNYKSFIHPKYIEFKRNGGSHNFVLHLKGSKKRIKLDKAQAAKMKEIKKKSEARKKLREAKKQKAKLSEIKNIKQKLAVGKEVKQKYKKKIGKKFAIKVPK